MDLCPALAHAGEPGVFVYGGKVVEIHRGHVFPLVGGCAYGVFFHDRVIAGEMAHEVDSHVLCVWVCFLHHNVDIVIFDCCKG